MFSILKTCNKSYSFIYKKFCQFKSGDLSGHWASSTNPLKLLLSHLIKCKLIRWLYVIYYHFSRT